MKAFFHPAVALLGIYPTDKIPCVQNDLFAGLVIVVSFLIVKSGKQPSQSSSAGGQEQIIVHPNHEIVYSHKKEDGGTTHTHRTVTEADWCGRSRCRAVSGVALCESKRKW